MARMVRKQLYFDSDLECSLAERALLLGVSQAEIVRRAVERYLTEERSSAREGVLRDLEASWAVDDIAGVGSHGARWTREQLHER